MGQKLPSDVNATLGSIIPMKGMGYLDLPVTEFSIALGNSYLRTSQRHRAGGVKEIKKISFIPQVHLKCKKYSNILVMKVTHPVNFLTLIYSIFQENAVWWLSPANSDFLNLYLKLGFRNLNYNNFKKVFVLTVMFPTL